MKIFNFLANVLIKIIFKIIDLTIAFLKWCWNNKRIATDRLWGAILVTGILIFFSSIKIGTEVCDGSSGEMNINPNGFVAEHLIYRCEDQLTLKFIPGAKASEQELTFNLEPPTEYNWTLLDLDKLAWAVAMHETGYCTNLGSPTANARNNCWGIMTWKNGPRELKTYSTTNEGSEDFKRIWARYYGGLPTYQDAEKYSGKDRAQAWYYNVLWAYNNN